MIILLIILIISCIATLTPAICALLGPYAFGVSFMSLLLLSAPPFFIYARKEFRRRKELSVLIKEARERKDMEMLSRYKSEYEFVEKEITRKDISVTTIIFFGLIAAFFIFMIVSNI